MAGFSVSKKLDKVDNLASDTALWGAPRLLAYTARIAPTAPAAADDLTVLPHVHPDLPPDHPHLAEHGPHHAHAVVIDDLHRRWPKAA